MSNILHLENFVMRRLNILWHDMGSIQTVSMTTEISYELFRDPDNDNRYRLDLKVRIFPKGKVKHGYEIETLITGIFVVPELDDYTGVDFSLRVNGATILYGILRGEIATVTGSFPGHKYLLETVNMKQLVTDTENRRARELKRESAEAEATRKKAVAKKAAKKKATKAPVKKQPSKKKVAKKTAKKVKI